EGRSGLGVERAKQVNTTPASDAPILDLSPTSLKGAFRARKLDAAPNASLLCRRSVDRKDKSKPRAASISVLNCDRAAVRFNNRAHNCQAHSQPFGFGSEERMEHTVPHLL